jgi:hypothetical protein
VGNQVEIAEMAKISWESEKELEDWIFDYARANNINPINEVSIDSIYRQVDLGAYGIADLLTFSNDPGCLDVTVIEVKKEFIDIKTFAQLSRYRKGLDIYFKNILPGCFSINMIAVSTEIQMSDDSVWLSDLLSEYTNFFPYTCRVSLDDGIEFVETKGWRKKNENLEKFHNSIGNKNIEFFNDFMRNSFASSKKIIESLDANISDGLAGES